MIKQMLKILVVLIILAVIVVKITGTTNIKKSIIEFFYPREYNKEVEKYSKLYGVDENLIYAIIKAESNFNEHAVSRSNAVGLMQLMYETAKDVAKILNREIDENKLLEPDTNINLGTKYISVLIEKYENIEVALAAYNAGSGNVDNWINNGTIKADGSDIENIPFKETNNYVRKILRDFKIYKNLKNQTISNVTKGWNKYENNPVLGDESTGSLFDPNVIIDSNGKYRMYVSWREKKSIAVTESEDRN